MAMRVSAAVTSMKERSRIRAVSSICSTPVFAAFKSTEVACSRRRTFRLVVLAIEREPRRRSGPRGRESCMKWERRLTEGYEATCLDSRIESAYAPKAFPRISLVVKVDLHLGTKIRPALGALKSRSLFALRRLTVTGQCQSV